MKRQYFSFNKITDNKWINLFSIKGKNSKGKIIDWIFASRKKDPRNDKGVDAVVIVPTIEIDGEKKLVLIKEFRWAINDYEYGFPAGLVEGRPVEEVVQKELKEETGLDLKKITVLSNPVYSSPGLTDEACVMAFVEAEGEVSVDHQEDSEEIEVLIYGMEEINNLLRDLSKKVGAKAWGILYYYSQIGRIE